MDIAEVAKPPRQVRSRKTYHALLDAAEALLRERPWEEISIVDITRAAGCSNGAIYGRFKGKDDVLVALYERHDARLKERFERERQSPPADETMAQFMRREIGQLIRTLRQDRWLLRAVGLLSRTKPNVVSPAMREERKSMFAEITARMLGYAPHFQHENPTRGAQLAVFFVATIAREAILYQGPHAGTLELDDDELQTALEQMALGFLGVTKNDKE